MRSLGRTSARSIAATAFVAGLGALALALLPAATAGAATCEGAFIGGGPSVWTSDPDDGEIARERLFDPALDVFSAYRGPAIGDYGVVEIDGLDYDNPAAKGCVRSSRGQGLGFPPDVLTLPGLEIRPKIYFSPRKPFGRQLVRLRNTSGLPLTFDVAWDGALNMNAGDHELHTTSSGNATIDAADRWAVGCQDVGNDGCLDVVNESDRDPELAHNFRGPAGAESPEVTLADNTNDIQVTFEDITVPAGKTVAYMEVVSLARNIGKAVAVAQAIDADPAGYGVLKGLTKRERKKLRNW